MSDDRDDAVSRRAYQLWESQGRGHGRDEEHWHQARRELGGDADPEDAGIAAPDAPDPTLTAPDGTTMADTSAASARGRGGARSKAEPAAPSADKAFADKPAAPSAGKVSADKPATKAARKPKGK